MSRAEIYQDESHEWRWRVVAGNQEITAAGESHTNRHDAERAFKTAFSNMQSAFIHFIEDQREDEREAA